MNNKQIGITLMVLSAFVFFFLMLMINWRSDFSFMTNLAWGAIRKIEDTSYECTRVFDRSCDHTWIRFKYVAIIPALGFVAGLFVSLKK